MNATETRAAWSEWQPLPGNWQPTPAVLAETLDGGQSFRWHQTEDGWTGLWNGCVAQLRLNKGAVEWRAPVTLAARVANSLPRYLGGEHDWSALTDSLPWRSDAHLAQCI